MPAKKDNSAYKSKRQVVRIGGTLREILTVHDAQGNLMHRAVKTLMLELHPHDVVQVIIGSLILTVPVGFTEEVWRLGSMLPFKNVVMFSILSLLFIAIFVYHNFYRHHFSRHQLEFFKRVFTIYFLSFLVAATFLTLIQQAPWSTDIFLALKRTILVAFPASMSAAVADMIK